MKNILFLLLIPFLLTAQSESEINTNGVKAYEEGDFEKARMLFIEAIEIKKDYDIGYFNKGLANRELKEYQKAISDFSKTIIITKDDKLKQSAIFNIVSIQRELNDLENALKNANRLIEIDSLSSDAHHLHGLILHEMGRNEDAIKSFNTAIKLVSDNPDIYYDRGIAKRRLNLIDEAILDYSIAIELDSLYSKAYNNRGFARVKIGDYKGAIKDYNKSIRIKEDAFSYNNRGFAKYKLGEFESAKMDCEKSIKMNPDNGWAYHYLGLIQYELGNKEEGCKLFKKAVELGKKDAKVDYLEKCMRF